MTEIRPAATLALVRDGDRGLEVLLLQRTWQAAFLPGHFVFPGASTRASSWPWRRRASRRGSGSRAKG